MKSNAFSMERIFGFCEKICYFLVINLLAVFCCLPVLLFFLLVGISQVRECLPLFLLCMTSVPLAFSAVLYAMNRVVRKEEGSPWRDYWKGYKSDLGQKFGLGGLQMFVIFVLWTNVEFFAKQIPILPLMIVFAVLFAFVILITPNLYLLSARYQMSSRQIIKDACILTVTRPGITLGNVAAMGLILAAMELSAGTTVLFMVSVYGFLVAFMSRGMLEALERV